MRLPLLLALSSACSQQPRRQHVVPDERNEEFVLPSRPVDAAVAFVDAAEVEPVDAGNVDLSFIRDQPDAGSLDAAVAEVDLEDPNRDITTIEAGVTVISTATRPKIMCVLKRGVGMCESKPGECKRGKVKCTLTKNYVCFSATNRTSGEEREMCFPNYVSCEAMRFSFDESPETASVTDCVIFRVRPKVRDAKGK